MAGWRTKIFGDTRFNFYGWIFCGLLVLGGAAREVMLALRAVTGQAQENHLLMAICILLIGQFAMSMQNYCARVAKVLDEESNK